MVKGSCLPISGMIPRGQYEVDRGRSCRSWRDKAMAEIRRNPPDLLVITASKSYRTQRSNGTGIAPFRVPGLWERGIKRLARQLPRKTKLLVLGDVPQNAGQPVDCLRGNTRDMSNCQARRLPPDKREVEVGQRKGAAAAGQFFGSLYYKICPYDPCPLVQGNTLIWRDKSHLTGTFARKLTPAVRNLITPYLTGELPGPEEPEEPPDELPEASAEPEGPPDELSEDAQAGIAEPEEDADAQQPGPEGVLAETWPSAEPLTEELEPSDAAEVIDEDTTSPEETPSIAPTSEEPQV
jgi:hypothetical protein